MSRIDQYLDAVGQAMETAGDIVPWPLHIATIMPYFSDLEAADLFAKAKAIHSGPNATGIMKGLLVGASVAKATLMDLIIGLKVARPQITPAERVWFVERLFDAITELQAGDMFCRNGANFLLRESEAQHLYESLPWHILDGRSDQRLTKALYTVSASAQALVWSLHFYGWTDVAFEVHGPYELVGRDGSRLHLVIRDFFDLKPSILWNSMATFPYDSLRVLTVHTAGSGLAIDIFNHLTCKSNLPATTVALYAEAGGTPLSTPEDAEVVSRTTLLQVSQQHQLIRRMSREELVGKFIESRYYAFRKWREYFREDWHPPAEVFRRVNEWRPISLSPSGAPDWTLLRQAFDPRSDVVPN